MNTLQRDTAFAAFVETERGLLQRCAFLLVGRREAADDLVAATLADLYVRWPATRTPLREALRLLATTDPDGLRLPWNRRARFELLESVGVREQVDAVVTDLGRLPADQRLVLVLERVARQPSVEIAAVLGADVGRTLALSHAAQTSLISADARRADDTFLTAELAAAVPDDLREIGRPDDLGHGRHLARRRWARRALGVVAGLAVLVLALTQFVLPRSTPAAGPAPTVTVTASPSVVACDKTQPSCQASLVRAWRAQMVEILTEYFDPDGTYFNGTSYYAADETDGLWTTKNGALAVEIGRLGEQSSTEVYVQIATDWSYAPRCGERTGTTCSSRLYMDGNRFTVSNSSDSRQGVELQYRSVGRNVVTITAQTIGKGRPSRLVQVSDLVRLAREQNLQLPDL